MKTERCFKILLFILIVGIAACNPTPPEKPPQLVTIQLKWLHQAQFAGYYVAQAKGYYAEENLMIRFIEGGKNTDLARTIISEKADFGLMSPEDIFINHSKGSNLTAIAAIYRRSAIVYAAMADSNIIRPADFIGKTVAVKGTDGAVRDMEFQFYAMMQKLNLDLSQVKLVPYDASYSGFYNRTVDVTAAYLTGGVMKIRHKGFKLNLIWPGDYGVHFYSDVMVTSDKTIAEEPDLVERFLRASFKGWNEVINDPETAVKETMKYAKGNNEKLQASMLDALIPLVHINKNHIGWMETSEWQQMYEVLSRYGGVKPISNVKEVFTMTFLERIYGRQKP